MRPLVALLLLALAPAPALADTWFWVDEDGVTHITDDPAAVPPGARAAEDTGGDSLRGLWGSVQAEADAPVVSGAEGDADAERLRRLLRGAVADLERGEHARASAALHSVLRLEPRSPEAHWYLALLDRQRGRYESSEVHLRAFLASAGEDRAAWRASAERRLAALEDEKRLASPESAASEAAWVGVSSPHFRVQYRAELGAASPDYATTVLRYLEAARDHVGGRLGTFPAEALGVRLYGKAAYLHAHRHRFSFQTVGFFDGRIHVVSAAHPAGELEALLFHEYTHAIFREQTGGDRPFWLNEGLAELFERASWGLAGITRSERSLLRSRIDSERWIPLRGLAPGFSGLDDEDARAAYLEATAAAAWIEERTEAEAWLRLLARLGEGVGDDEAFREVLDLDTDGIDAAIRAAILAEFPALPTRQQASD